MDLNIQVDAGDVTGGLDGAVSALERIKRLVESTEPFGTHLAKGSKVEVDGLMAQMRRLVGGVEGDMKRVASALKGATPKDMREELQRTLAPMRQLVTLAAELSKAKFSGMGGTKAADEVRKVVTTVQQLADAYDRLTVETNQQAAAAQIAAAKTAQANLQAKENLDAQVRAAQARVQAFIQNHPAGVLPARSLSLSSMNMGSSVGPTPGQLATQASTTAARAAAAAAASTNALAAAQTNANAAAKTGQATSLSLTQVLKGQAASANDLHSAYRGLASGFGAMWLTWGNALPLLAGAGLSHAVTGAIKAGMQFETVMTNMGAQADITGKDMSKLTATVLEMGAARERGPKELAEGLKVLALAGQTAAQQMQTLPTLLDFAKVGEMGLGEAAEQLVAVGTAFGYQANEMQVVADVIAKTAASSMASTSDMAQAFRSASVLATQFNVSLKDVAGGLGLLSQIGIKGSAAGTSLRQAYVELTGTSKDARAALEKMGISIYNAEGGTRSLRDVVTQLAGKMEGLTKSQRDHLLQVISNERGMKTLAAVMAQLQDEAAKAGTGMTSFLQKLEGDIGNAAGYTALKAIEMGQTTEQQFKRVAATLETSFVKAFEVAQPAVNQLAAALREALGSQEFVNAVGAIASTLVSLATVVVKNIELISLLGGAYVASKVGLTAFHAVAALLGPALTAAGVGASAAATATGSLTAAAGIAARAFWPLAAAIAAAAAAYSLYKALSGSADADARAKAAAAGNEAADMQKRAAEMRKTAEDIRNGMSAGTSQEISRFSQSTEAALAALDERAGRLRQENAKLEKVQSRNAYYDEQRAERLRSNEQKINEIYRERNKVQSEFFKGRQALLQGASAVERATEERAKRDAERAQKLFAGLADPKMVKLAESGGGRTRKPREGMEPGEGDLAKAKAHNDELDRTIKLYREAAAAGTSVDKLTESQKKELLIKQQLQTEMKGEVRARKEAELAEVQASIAKERTLETLKEEAKEREKVKESTAKLTDSIRKQADDLEVANGVFGKGKIAIGEATLAQMEAGKAMGALIKVNGEWVESTQEMIDAQERLNEAMREAEYKKVMKDLDGQLAAAQDQADLLKQEAELVGLTALERAKVVAQHKVELDYRKRIREIDQSELSDSQKEVARARAAQTRAVETSNAVNKVIQDDFQKTADQINQSLTDALLRGFEDGKGFGKNFADTLKNMFKTLVLRPVISFIVNPIGNAISGIVSGFLGGGQGGAGGILGGATNGNSVLNFGSLIANWMGAGSGAAAGTLAYGNMIGALGGDGLGAFMAANGGWGTSGFGAVGSSLGGIGGSAVGLGVVAAPLVIGALAERNSRDRYGGAAYATSDWRNDPLAATIGADFNGTTGSLPDRAALEERARQAGIAQATMALFGGNDRAFLHYVRLAEGGGIGDNGLLPDPRKLIEQSNLYGADFYRGAGYASPQAMGWWNDKHSDLLSNDPAVVAASRALSESIVAPLAELGKLMGDAEALRVTTGFANRGQGALWGAARIERGGQTIMDMERGDYADAQQYMRAVYRASLGALDELDLPAWAGKLVNDTQTQLDALTGDKVGEQAAAIYTQAADGIRQMYGQIKTLIDVFPDFSAATQDSVYALQALMGGIDGLQSAYSAYIGAFWTEEERSALMTAQLTAQLAALGQTMPATRDEFRAMVEAALAAGTAGAEVAAALLGMAPAMADVLKPAEAAAVAAPVVREYSDAVADSGAAARDATASIADAWRTLLDEVDEIARMTADAVRDLRGEVDATRQQAAAGANAYIEQALADMRATGALPDAEGLRNAIDDARAGLRAEDYASMSDFRRDQLILAGKLEEISGVAGRQKSYAEQQIDLLSEGNDLQRQQLDELRRVMQAGGPVGGGAGAGMLALVPGFAAGGLHAGGLRVVGENGPELEMTGPARYWSFQQSRAMLGGAGDSESAAETRALRAEVERLNALVRRLVDLSQSTNAMIDQVTAGGDAVQVTGKVRTEAA